MEATATLTLLFCFPALIFLSLAQVKHRFSTIFIKKAKDSDTNNLTLTLQRKREREKQKKNMFSSLMRGDVSASASDLAKKNMNKVDIQAQRKVARTTCTAQHNLVKPFQDQVNQCRSSQYWNYGYRLGSALTLFGVSMAASHRFPQLGYGGSSIFAIVGGFYFGGIFHQVHVTWLQAKLITQIDKSLAVLEKADVTQGSNIGVPEYREAIDVILKLKQQEVQLSQSTSAILAGLGLGGGAGAASPASSSSGSSADGHRLVITPGQQADPLEMEAQRIIADYDRRQAIKKGLAK